MRATAFRTNPLPVFSSELDQALDRVLTKVHDEEGFTLLQQRLQRALERLARRRRGDLASEGWIS